MKKILLKLSGEALLGEGKNINPIRLKNYASDIVACAQQGVQIAIVIGGGNIYRGMNGVVDRVQGDYMGMLATLINSIALQDALQKQGANVQLFSALGVSPLALQPSRALCKKAMSEGKIILLAAGTGNPYFTTDTAGVLRAIEIQADMLLKGTRVNGIYTADPEKDPNATKYSHLTYSECMERHLNVMDQTAFALACENDMPICVFDMNTKGNLLRLINGQDVGTIVTSK